jgi:UDP-glucose 4-epimerase
MLKDAYARHGIRSATLRYFNAAGADPEGELGEDHNPETHLIPIALQVLAGKRKKLTVYGKDYTTKDGTCVRDYIHVNDLAVAHLQALDYVVRENACEQFNLGTAHGYSVLEIIDAIRRVTGKELPYEVGARRAGDPAVLVADASKARRLLGWKPEFDLDSIVRTAYQWALKHPNGYATNK